MLVTPGQGTEPPFLWGELENISYGQRMTLLQVVMVLVTKYVICRRWFLGKGYTSVQVENKCTLYWKFYSFFFHGGNCVLPCKYFIMSGVVDFWASPMK